MADYLKFNINSDNLTDVTLQDPVTGDEIALDCLVIDNIITFGKMQAPGIIDLKRYPTMVQFNLKNNNVWEKSSNQVIYYELDNSSPSLGNIPADSKVDAGRIQLTGLTDDTAYTLFARTYYDGVYSGLTQITFVTGTYDDSPIRPEAINVSVAAETSAILYLGIRETLTLDLYVDYIEFQNPYKGIMQYVNFTASGSYDLRMDHKLVVAEQTLTNTLYASYIDWYNPYKGFMQIVDITTAGSYGFRIDHKKAIETQALSNTLTASYIDWYNPYKGFMQFMDLSVSGSYGFRVDHKLAMASQALSTNLTASYIDWSNPGKQIVETFNASVAGTFNPRIDHKDALEPQTVGLTLYASYVVAEAFNKELAAQAFNIQAAGTWALRIDSKDALETQSLLNVLYAVYTDWYNPSKTIDQSINATVAGSFAQRIDHKEELTIQDIVASLSAVYTEWYNPSKTVAQAIDSIVAGTFNPRVDHKYMITGDQSLTMSLTAAYQILESFNKEITAQAVNLIVSGTFANRVDSKDALDPQALMAGLLAVYTEFYNPNKDLIEQALNASVSGTFNPRVDSRDDLDAQTLVANLLSEYLEFYNPSQTVSESINAIIAGTFSPRVDHKDALESQALTTVLTAVYQILESFDKALTAQAINLATAGSFEYRIDHKDELIAQTLTGALTAVYLEFYNPEKVIDQSINSTISGSYGVRVDAKDYLVSQTFTAALTAAYQILESFSKDLIAQSINAAVAGAYGVRVDHKDLLLAQSLATDLVATYTDWYNPSKTIAQSISAVVAGTFNPRVDHEDALMVQALTAALTAAYQILESFSKDLTAQAINAAVAGTFNPRVDHEDALTNQALASALQAVYTDWYNPSKTIAQAINAVVAGTFNPRVDHEDALTNQALASALFASYVSEQNLATPTATIIARTETTMTFRISNPNNVACTLHYGPNSSMTNSVAIAASPGTYDYVMTLAGTEYIQGTLYAKLSASGSSDSATLTMTDRTGVKKPTWVKISEGYDSVVYQVTNNSAYGCVVYRALDDSTPFGSGGIYLPAGVSTNGSTYPHATYTSLDNGSTHTFYTEATLSTNTIYTSGVVTATPVTLAVPAPTVTAITITHNSITWRITNNANVAVTMYHGTATNPTGGATALAANGIATYYADIVTSSLSEIELYTRYARVKVGTIYSITESGGGFTLLAPPTITQYLTVTDNQIYWRVTNNSAYTVLMYYEMGDTSPDLYSISLAPGAYTNYAPSITDDTYYTLYAQATYDTGYYGIKTSNVVSSGSVLTKMHAPTINYVSKTTTSVTFTVTNNSARQADIYMDVGNSIPTTARMLNVAAGGTTWEFTISGLSAGTSYTFYARAQSDYSSQYSGNAVTSITTTQNTTATPSWSSNASVSYTTARVYYKNNDASTATVYITVNGVEKSVSVGAGLTGYCDFTGLTHNTAYTSTARAQASNELMSATSSAAGSFTTLQYQTATPSWSSNASVLYTTARVYYTNNDGSTATVYITVNGVEKSVSVGAGLTGYCDFTGLTPGTSYTSTARAQASGETMSATSSAAGGFTTLLAVTDTPSWSTNTLITSTTVRVTYANNDEEDATVYITVNGVEKSVVVSGWDYGYCDFTGLTKNTAYTSTARAQATGKSMSATSSAAGSFTTLQQYTVTWKNYAGTTLLTDTVDAGSTSYAPTGTTDTQQYDYYWSPTSTVPTANVTITELRQLQYYVTYWISYGGTTLKTDVLPYGSVSYAPTGTTDTAQYDYFWSPGAVATYDNTYQYEQRQLRSYTITYSANGGTGGTTQSFTYGTSSATVSANAPTVTRTGYTFTGWSPAWSTVTGTKTYSAQWVLSSTNVWTYLFEVTYDDHPSTVVTMIGTATTTSDAKSELTSDYPPNNYDDGDTAVYTVQGSGVMWAYLLES